MSTESEVANSMRYTRPEFGTGKTQNGVFAFGNLEVQMPVFESPISPKENFYRSARRDHPLWVPFPAVDTQELHMFNLATEGPEGCQLGPNLCAKQDRYVYHDAFGNSWTFDKAAGGACMTIGTRVCDDILKWEEQVHFPDFHEWNMEETAKDFMENRYDPERALHIDIYHGPFQALSDLLGGFAEALEAMFVEPEASGAFFDRFADWYIWLIDKLSALYPVDMFTAHDDWGTEKDTFFSQGMLDELLYEPTKRIIDHVHGMGKIYQFHNCGRVERFMPTLCDLGPELVQLQRRVNDTPKYKELYGDRVGFNTGLENLVPGKAYTDEELARIVRESVDIFGEGGGFLPAVYGGSPETLWKIYSELYCYSREYYEKA